MAKNSKARPVYGGFSASLLKALMDSRGWSNARLVAEWEQANGSTLTTRTVENWLSSKTTDPPASTLGFLSNALQCDPKELLEKR